MFVITSLWEAEADQLPVSFRFQKRGDHKKESNIPRKCRNQEAQPFQGTKRRGDKVQIRIKQMPHMPQ